MEVVACVLWYAGDRCSQTALERVRGNPELAPLTRVKDVRNPRYVPPPQVTLVPTLTVMHRNGETQLHTGKMVHMFARNYNAVGCMYDRAVLPSTDLRYALGSDGLEMRAELAADIQ